MAMRIMKLIPRRRVRRERGSAAVRSDIFFGEISSRGDDDMAALQNFGVEFDLIQ
jgi:hypothetical protein